jgi:hypothetical protein
MTLCCATEEVKLTDILRFSAVELDDRRFVVLR